MIHAEIYGMMFKAKIAMPLLSAAGEHVEHARECRTTAS